MNDLLFTVQRRVEFALQFLAVAAQHANRKRSEIVEEILVDKLAVNAKVMGVGGVARLKVACVKGHKVKTIYINT